jgi:hypothetical protein
MTNTRTFVLLLLSATLLAACQQDGGGDKAYEQLREDHERALRKIAAKDSAMNAFFDSFNRINENLRIVRQKQGVLGAAPGGVEGGKDQEELIIAEIASIDELLDENRRIIANLRGDARGGADRVAAMERSLEEMERAASEQAEEVATLKEMLASSNSSLATLIEMYRDKSQLAEIQREELNAAWYAVGTARELRENGVLTREGGVAGIGGVDKLKTDDLRLGYFKRIDITTDTEIPLAASKARLATSHPDGSYRIADGKLIVVDSEAFWSLSRYLVVVVS